MYKSLKPLNINRIFVLNNIKFAFQNQFLATRLTADGKEIPKKKKSVDNRITLIGVDNSVSITDLKDAQNLSNKRELKLVKIQDVDSKTRRPVYKLMTNAEYHKEELDGRKARKATRESLTIKGDKLLTLSARIGNHDLMTGVNKMIKLLNKQYEVKVIISGEDGQEMQKSEEIYMEIEKNIKSVGKVVQKRSKGSSLRFQLIPVGESNNNSKSSADQDNQNNNDRGPL